MRKIRIEVNETGPGYHGQRWQADGQSEQIHCPSQSQANLRNQIEYSISSDNPNGFARTVVRWSLLSLYQGNGIRMEGLNIRNSKCRSEHKSMNKLNGLGQKNYLLKLHYIGKQISRLTLLLKQGYKIKFRNLISFRRSTTCNFESGLSGSKRVISVDGFEKVGIPNLFRLLRFKIPCNSKRVRKGSRKSRFRPLVNAHLDECASDYSINLYFISSLSFPTNRPRVDYATWSEKSPT